MNLIRKSKPGNQRLLWQQKRQGWGLFTMENSDEVKYSLQSCGLLIKEVAVLNFYCWALLTLWWFQMRYLWIHWVSDLGLLWTLDILLFIGKTGSSVQVNHSDYWKTKEGKHPLWNISCLFNKFKQLCTTVN